MSESVDAAVVLDLVTEPTQPAEQTEPVQPAEPTEPTEPTKPAKPVESKGRGGDPYKLCDLCNAIVYNEDAHRQLEHGDVQLVQSHAAPLRAPQLAGAEASESDDTVKLGAFVYDSVRVADQGRAMFGVIQNASQQLRRLLSETLADHPQIYLFGSCVSMGIWDGMGDADFSVIFPKLLAAHRAEFENAAPALAQDDDEPANEASEPAGAGEESPDDGTAAAATGDAAPPSDDDATAVPAPVGDPATCQPLASAPVLLSDRKKKEMEGKFVLDIAHKLRNGGFKFEELEVVPRTRVPLVKRRSEAKRPYELRRLDEKYHVVIYFDDFYLANKFHTGSYGAVEVPGETRKTGKGVRKTFAFADGAAALRFFSRRETVGITKQWAIHHRLPEIFSVDFDISCRCFGIRNSWFLREYLAQDPVFRAGNLFIKQWSKVRGVNFSRQGYLTSYAMSCLWIYYLLCAGEATFVDPAQTPFEPTPAQENIAYMPLWPFAVDSPAHAAQLARLGKLVRGFFHFYTHEFDYDTTVVTLRRDVREASQRMTREERGWVETQGLDSILLRERIYTGFSIEDVYEDLNLGRHLTPLKLAWVRAQFAGGLACCDKGHFTELLLNPFDEAEESLRAALFVHLVRGGPCTIASLREHLLASQARSAMYLATYELRHRLSDLWFDESIQQSDTKSGQYHGRRLDNWTPPVNPVTQGQWAAVCTSDAEPEATSRAKPTERPRRVNEELETFGERVVCLVGPDGEVVREGIPAVTAWYDTVSADMAKPIVHPVGVALPLHNPLRPLLARLFFSIDGGARVFDSFAAKTVFAAHLRFVAISLASAQAGPGAAQPTGVLPVGATVKQHKAPQRNAQKLQLAQLVDEVVTAVVAQIDTRKLGSAQKPLIRYILFSPSYVSQSGASLKATPQLEAHGGQVAAEEAVHRVKTTHVNPRQNLPRSNNGNNRRNNNYRRDRPPAPAAMLPE